MSVHKYKGEKTWTVKYKNKTHRGFTSKKEAELYEAKLKTGDAKTIGKGITYEKGFNDYIEHISHTVSYGTVQKHCGIYNDIIKPHFPVTSKIENITKQDCREFYEWLYNSDYATSYKNIILCFLEAVFKHCDTYYETGYNPASSLQKYKLTFNEKALKRAKQFDVWTPEEFSKFISYVDNETYKTLLVVLYYTGMRKGEALALKWSDYYNGVFDINKNITNKTENKGYEVKDTKNIYSNRKVSVGKNLKQFIDAYKNREMLIAGFNEDWFMFGRMKPISTTSLDRAKERAIQLSGVKRIRIHDLRHSHASNLFAQNIDYITISKRLGHNSPQTTLNIYAHLIGDSNDVVNRYLDNSSQYLPKIFPDN